MADPHFSLLESFLLSRMFCIFLRYLILLVILNAANKAALRNFSTNDKNIDVFLVNHRTIEDLNDLNSSGVTSVKNTIHCGIELFKICK